MSAKKLSSNTVYIFKIVFAGILVALNIILERLLAYSVWNQTISFGFITVAFAAAFLGVPYAIAVAGLGDLIGSLAIPFGPYFPGFTLTNCLVGLITAVFIYKHPTIPRVVLSVFINKIVNTLILNTVWISFLYRGGIDAFFTVLIPRIPAAALMAAIEIIVLILIFSNKSKVRTLLDKQFKSLGF